MQQVSTHGTRNRRIFLACVVLLAVFAYLYMFVLPLSSVTLCRPSITETGFVCRQVPMPWWPAHEDQFF
jgi:hypothetical protein